MQSIASDMPATATNAVPKFRRNTVQELIDAGFLRELIQ